MARMFVKPYAQREKIQILYTCNRKKKKKNAEKMQYGLYMSTRVEAKMHPVKKKIYTNVEA